ncbi:MAG: ABC transporter permease [Chloroflexota bacterium]
MAQQVFNRAEESAPKPENLTTMSMGAGGGAQFIWNFTDTFVLAQRNLLYYIRQPELLVFATIQPVIFLLLFTYVFGGAIAGGTGVGGDAGYINFLLPGIIIQTIIFAATNTTTGLSNDLSKGLIDRFRSLPMARSAVLAGRTLADTARALFTATIMILVGFLLGFRFENGLLNGLIGVFVAISFGHAFTWISAFIALFIKDPEAAQVAGFVWVFPLTFASSVFVPTESMPTWLRVFAENQPITIIANTVRGFMATGDTSQVWLAFAWIAGIFFVFMPLAVRQYAKVASR